MPASFVNLANTRRRPDDTYRRTLQKIRRDGVCPFCPRHLRRYHQKPIIRNGKHWLLTDNMYPYKGMRHHLLLVHKKHIERLSEITGKAWNELLKFMQAEIKKRAIGGGTFYIRLGDPAYTGASVAHLHANLISPDIRKKNRKPIFTRVG